MKTYGLKVAELDQLKKLLQKHFGHIEDAKVFIFGSRAKGKQAPFSDIDITIKSKSKKIESSINLLKEDWENSSLPYKLDISSWNELFKPYLPEINRTKELFWRPDEEKLHPWRICPYGEHWVARHPRSPLGKKIQDVDGHCRRNRGGKDHLKSDEIQSISKMSSFNETNPKPSPYLGGEKIVNPDQFDNLIAGWCKYWNDVLKPNYPIEPNFVKSLIESESRFKTEAFAKNKDKIGPARGLIQITEETWRILKNPKSELKDHFIDVKKEELFDPNINICAGIRWLFRKKEILQKRINRDPSWSEVIIAYKGIGPGLKKKDPKSLKIIREFEEIYQRYQRAK